MQGAWVWSLVKELGRRQWHPTPVLLPGKSRGQRSLVGCSPWGRWESDTTERLHFHFSLSRIETINVNMPNPSVCLLLPPQNLDPEGENSCRLWECGNITSVRTQKVSLWLCLLVLSSLVILTEVKKAARYLDFRTFLVPWHMCGCLHGTKSTVLLLASHGASKSSLYRHRLIEHHALESTSSKFLILEVRKRTLREGKATDQYQGWWTEWSRWKKTQPWS